MTIGQILFFGLGGGLGAIMRVFLGQVVGDRFPWGTLLVNVIGSMLVGFLITLFAENPLTPRVDEERFANGFCGGFTTFSSFSYQTAEMFSKGQNTRAILNIGSNLILSLGSVWSGIRLGMTIFN